MLVVAGALASATFGVSAASATLLTVTLDGPLKGSVTSQPDGINCSNVPGAEASECSFDYPFNSFSGIKLTAVGADGASLRDWAGNAGGTCFGPANPCITERVLFTPLEVTATFAPTPGEPSASTGAVSDVAFPSAVLSGTVNPESTEFALSDCYFEYGTSTGYGSKVQCDPGTIAAGTAPVPVTATVGLLASETTYHYRVVAVNAGGKSVGEDQTFTSAAAPADPCPNAAIRAEQGPIAQRLPGCLAYELVSPPSTLGMKAEPVTMGPSGDDVIFRSTAAIADSNYSTPFGGPLYRARRTPSGWATESMGGPPMAELQGYGAGDWQANWWQVDRPLQMVSAQPPFDPDSTDNGSRYLVGTKGGEWIQVTPAISPIDGYGEPVIATTKDLSSVLLGTELRLPLTDGTVDTRTPGAGVNSLVVSRPLADGTLDRRQVARQGGATMFPTCTIELGAPGNGMKRGAVDRDALERVIWTTGGGGCTTGTRRRVYVSEPFSANPDAIDISASKCTVSCGAISTVRFAGASLDTERIFMTTTQKLLDADTNTTSDIYEYDFRRPLADRLQLVTNDATPANVLGVVNVSDTGSHVYFVSRAVLAGAVTGDTVPAAGSPNLYVRTAPPSGGPAVMRFLATLDEADASLWAGTGGLAVLTPDGRYLALTASAALTDDKQPGDTLPDVYRIDSSTGQIDRAWVTDLAHNGALRSKGSVGPASGASSGATFQNGEEGSGRLASDGSAIVFTTEEPLFAGDDNDAADVFVWTASDGAVSMLSDGHDPYGVSFARMTPDGSSFTFSTRSRLLPQHTATSVGLYVVRKEGGFAAPEAPPAPCAGDACQGPNSAPPASAGIGSSGSGGNGNVPGPARASVRVAKVKPVTGPAAALRIRVPSAGRISVAGSSVRSTSRSVPRNGSYPVTIHLKRSAREQLRKQGTLRVVARVSYRAEDGGSAEQTLSVTFKQPKAKGKKGGR